MYHNILGNQETHSHYIPRLVGTDSMIEGKLIAVIVWGIIGSNLVNSTDPAVGSGAPVRSIEKTTGSLHLPYQSPFSIMTVPANVCYHCSDLCGPLSHCSCTNIQCRDPNTVFMTYPMHNLVPYWLSTMVYACVPHFNLWRGHKHPCSFHYI